MYFQDVGSILSWSLGKKIRKYIIKNARNLFTCSILDRHNLRENRASYVNFSFSKKEILNKFLPAVCSSKPCKRKEAPALACETLPKIHACHITTS